MRLPGAPEYTASDASHIDRRRQAPVTIKPLKVTEKTMVLDRAPDDHPPSLGTTAMASLYKTRHLLDGPDGMKASH